MAAHLSDRKRPHLRPGQQALVVVLIASAITAPAWSWAVIESPASVRPIVALAGGLVAILLCAAVAVAAHQTAVARNARAHATRVDAGARTLEEETGWVVDVLLPALDRAVHEDRSAQDVLAEHPRPAHPTVDRLARTATARMAAVAERSVRDRHARTEIEEQITALADIGVPLMGLRIRDDRTVAEEVLAQEFPEVHPPVAHLRARILDRLLAGDRRAATALVSTADCGARLQAHLTTLLAQLRELQERYGDRSDVFSDLLEVDHNVSRTGRLADALVTLAEGRSGRRWTRPIVMESILRGAMGRITAYRRVRLHYTSTIAVVGYAAEGVMQALAEIMDNAANFSAQGTDVHVYAQEEDTGVTITVEDSGMGLRHRERRLAESLLAEPRDLSTLPSSRVGLAVVGRLADKYGLRVSLRPSARGGIGVVVLIPPNLLTEPRRPEPRPRANTQEIGTPAAVGVLGGSGPQYPVAPTGGHEAPRPAAPRSTAGPQPGTEPPPLPRRDGARPPVDTGHEQHGRPPAGTGEKPAESHTDLPRRRRGLTLAEAVRENPEQLYAPRSAQDAPVSRGGLPTRFAAFRDAGTDHDDHHPGDDA
ncbi:ATP-binding protein [Nocardiopsis sp. MG754419]|uniref:sensor histidine kinase n=1 Tax=Nocardiopsis sp. MG754419 TaxID=2259865 RepID=UPI001BAA0F48|nr:ATP-binding protein [Nocardiopsis sp. MG754419]MBR8744543.1 sensor histidine kinase [Nocardiopsis sp. MG754419]